LPYKNGNAGTLKVYLNNAAVDSAGAEVLLTGSTYTFTVSGSGNADSLIVRIDGSDIYSCTINFTTDPVTVSNEKTIADAYADSFYKGASSNIPDVSGLTESEAIAKLEDKGFYNVVVSEKTTANPANIGLVIDQTPSVKGIDKYKRYETDTTVVIYIGKGVLG